MLKNSRNLILFLFLVIITGIIVISCTERDIDKVAGPKSDIGYNLVSSRFRDYVYKDGMIFDLGRLGGDKVDFDTLAGDKILEIAVYRKITANDGGGIACRMYIDPDDTTEYEGIEHLIQISVIEVPDTEYYVNPNSFWIFFKQPYAGVPNYYEIGVWMVVERGGGEIDTIGNISEIPYHLKLIHGRYSFPTYITWDYMWRNVYDLGIEVVQPENLDVRIYYGLQGTEGDRDNQDHNEAGVPYITILKLDRYDNRSGAMIPDGEFDNFADVLLPTQSLLIFPIREPFDYHAVGDTSLPEYIPAIYNTTRVSNEAVKASRYYFVVRQKVRIDINTVMGDLNLNGVYYEIDDAETFEYYFLYGVSAFRIDETFQTAASDVDCDGTPLTIGDFVYLLRIINGDSLPSAEDSIDLNLNVYFVNDTMYLDKPVGGLLLTLKGDTEHYILDGIQNMQMIGINRGQYARMLIYSFSRYIEPNVPIIRCSAASVEIQAADFYGHNYIIAGP